MNRNFFSYPIADVPGVKSRLLHWAASHDFSCILDNHRYTSPYHSYEYLVAVGIKDKFIPGPDYFKDLSRFVQTTNDWIVGHFAYDHKNKIEAVSSQHPDYIGFEESLLVIPQVVILLKENELSIGVLNQREADEIFKQISHQDIAATPLSKIIFKPRITKEQYIATIHTLQQHIQKGDCYEINFCQEFYAAGAAIHPVAVYEALTKTSPSPFSCFYRNGNSYLLCASPERYLKKSGAAIVSQPIKGTWKRAVNNEAQDLQNKIALQNSRKDKSENVMVVDLVRNDLSKVCENGSVKVTELFEVYSYPNVHQMISTITGTLKQDIYFGDIIKATFPMGSMTGAPKIRVMELIEQYEATKRGIFSGTVGYITPEKDFDFNVVIRSLLYNSSTKYVSYLAGSGITYYSQPEAEYEECLLKAAAITVLFGGISGL